MIDIVYQAPLNDTCTNSALPYENYEGYPILFVGSYKNCGMYQTLLKFCLPSFIESGVIEKVELLLYVMRNDDKNQPKEIRVKSLLKEYDPCKVNHDNLVSSTKEIYGEFSIKEELDQYIAIDITRLFSLWYTKKLPNYGLMLQMKNTQDALIGFYSQECTKEYCRPKLKIYFQKIAKNIESSQNIQHEPYESKDYFYQLQELINSNKDGSLDLVEKGIERYPKFTELMFIKGQILKDKKEFYDAIECFKKCMKMGESSLESMMIYGVGSFLAYIELGEIYYELNDTQKAYEYVLKSVVKKGMNKKDGILIGKILKKAGRDAEEIESILKSFMIEPLGIKEYDELMEVYYHLGEYKKSYVYLMKFKKYDKDNIKLDIREGELLLYLKEYERAYEKLKEIHDKRCIRLCVICKVCKGEVIKARKLLNGLKNPEDVRIRKIYDGLLDVMEKESIEPISENLEESKIYLDEIMCLLDILITVAPPEIFEKTLQLLNTIESQDVLLRLGKLYYHHDLYDMAYKEFLRSIKILDRMDQEGIHMMKKSMEKK